jgi:hypothetical protein
MIFSHDERARLEEASLKPTYQGKAHVFRDTGGDLFVVYPDGDNQIVNDAKDAEKKLRAWYKKHMPKSGFGVGQVVWGPGTRE